jgi:hypothetical protein
VARSGPLLVFLDVNILFSAALGGPAFEALRALAQNGTIRLTTSEACVIEAETNLARKRPARQEALASVLATITVQGRRSG